MTAGPAALRVAGSAALLERAISYTRSSLSLVRPELLTRPTPCSAWDLAALLTHMNDSMLALHEAVVAREVSLRPVPDDPALEVAAVATLRLHACDLLGEWSRLHEDSPVEIGDARLPASVVALAGSLEIAVHGWDVARACGAEWPLPEGLASALLDAAPGLIGADDRGSGFAAPVEVPRTATASDHLLAFTGRRPC